jgi:hypothetical protein
MVMRKMRIVTFVLALLVLCASVMPVQKVEAASDIYFAGKYKCIKSKDSLVREVSTTLKMNEYSSPEGKIVGNFKIDMPIPHAYNTWKGTLKKVGKNKYVYKKGKVKIQFKVYKKKVVISQNCTNNTLFCNLSGTYKLKKRYQMP